MPAQEIVLDYPSPDTICLKLKGDWRISSGFPGEEDVFPPPERIKNIRYLVFDVSGLGKWDSCLVAFLFRLVREFEKRGVRADLAGLPSGARKLIALALKTKEKNETVSLPPDASFLEAVADRALEAREGVLLFLNFLGETVSAFGRMFSGKVYFRWDEFTLLLQRCGADALFLVSLISILVGVILAFIGATQLKLFGAQIYIANIVGIGMVRVMGAMMAAILMSGRTGASFAAELGLMQNNEEIDALRTLGVSPVEFLVLPRILALLIMMPLLTIYADLMGILGGLFISVTLMGLNPVEYWQHTQSSVTLVNVFIGIAHSLVFGLIIALAGCFRGMQCRRSAEAIGEATTGAVVSAIISIVVATAIITFVCQVLGV